MGRKGGLGKDQIISTELTGNIARSVITGIVKFTGYNKDDESGLDFAEARMYENRHGRFTAVDPLLASGKSANPQTFNRFVYVVNSPLIYVDSNGLQIGNYVGPVYYNPHTGDFGEKKFAEKYPELRLERYSGPPVTRCLESGYCYIIEPDRVTEYKPYGATEPGDIPVLPSAVDAPASGSDDRFGPPNSWSEFRNRFRFYDELGRALLDIDYHDEAAGNPHHHWWDWTNENGPGRSPAEPIPEGWRWDQETEDGKRNWSPWWRQGMWWDLVGSPLEVVPEGQPVHWPGAVPVDAPPVPLDFPIIVPPAPGTSFPAGTPVIVPQTTTPLNPPVLVRPIFVPA